MKASASRWILAPALLGLACSPPLPDGVRCDRAHIAANDAELAAALKEAAPGDCVVLRAGTYRGSISIDAGVTLVAERDATVELVGAGAVQHVVRLRGRGSALIDVRVRGGDGSAVIVDAASTLLRGVEAGECPLAAIAVRCEDGGCLHPTGQIELRQVKATAAGFGLWINASQVVLRDAELSDNTSSGLSGGAGLFLLGGARLEARDCAIARNQVGAVIDGPDTRVSLRDGRITANSERGLWAQRLRGTTAEPALHLHGAGTWIEDNGVAGVGVVDSQGVLIEDATIRATRALQVPVRTGEMAPVGDGVGLFEGSGQVVVQNSTLTDNGRAQALVDQAGVDVVFESSNLVQAGQGQHKIVVQNSVDAVSVPSADLSQVAELPISAPRIAIPEL